MAIGNVNGGIANDPRQLAAIGPLAGSVCRIFRWCEEQADFSARCWQKTVGLKICGFFLAGMNADR